MVRFTLALGTISLFASLNGVIAWGQVQYIGALAYDYIMTSLCPSSVEVKTMLVLLRALLDSHACTRTSSSFSLPHITASKLTPGFSFSTCRERR